MTDPLLPESSSLIWKIITGFTALLGSILAWIWKKQDAKVKELEARMVAIEKDFITRPVFDGANAAIRREMKEELKNVVDELHICSGNVNESVRSLRSELTARFDTFITLWAKDK